MTDDMAHLDEKTGTMNSEDEAPLQRAGRSELRPYHAPHLLEYGAIRELTASGTGSQMENPAMMGNTFRP